MRLILVCLLSACLALAKPDGGGGYTTKYDDIDIKEIMGNERLYQKYSKCILNEGPCTADAKELKEIIPDALEDGCAKCNEKQLEKLEEVMRTLSTEHPEDLKKLRELYDKEGKYAKRYEELAKKHNIKLS